MHPSSLLLPSSTVLPLAHTHCSQCSRNPDCSTLVLSTQTFLHPSQSLQIKPLILVLLSLTLLFPCHLCFVSLFSCIRQPHRNGWKNYYPFSFSPQPLLLPHQEEISYLITAYETDKMPILPPIYNDHLILQAPHKEQNLHGPSYFHIVINNLSMRGVKDRRDHICCCTALH